MSIRIGFVGDLMFSHNVRNAQLANKDPLYPLLPVLPLIKQHDLFVGNLETTVTFEHKAVAGSRDTYWCIPEAIKAVKDAGFSVVSLANNHLYDFGEEGVNATLAELQKNKLPYFGLMHAKHDKGYQYILSASPAQKIGLLGYTPYNVFTGQKSEYGFRLPKPQHYQSDIPSLKAQCSFVVVILHEGSGSELPSPEMMERCRGCIDSGADLVVCHHSHLLSGYEMYHGKLIAYGLGNFVAAANNFSELRRRGVILSLEIGDAGLERFEFLPTYVNDSYQTEPANPETSETILNRIQELSVILQSENYREQYNKSYDMGYLKKWTLESLDELTRGSGKQIFKKIARLRPTHIKRIAQAIVNGVRGKKK